MADPTIITRNLTKVYGKHAVVDKLDVELESGEIFGLLGPNGAGKTTTILMLLGLVEPTSGTIRVLGLDPSRNPIEVKRRVGYLPDAVGFYDRMTGHENLLFTADLNGLKRGQAKTRIAELLEEVGLQEAGSQPTGEYSRGMLQRLGIADALLKDPDILILDEPTTAIDPEGVAETLSLIRRLADDRGVTVLLSSHLLHQVQAICDRVAIFVRGKVVSMGAPHELAASESGPETIEIGVDTDIDLRASLDDHSVSEVRPARLPRRWILTIERGATSKVVQSVLQTGAGITSLHQASEDLDAIYRRYFKEAEHV